MQGNSLLESFGDIDLSVLPKKTPSKGQGAMDFGDNAKGFSSNDIETLKKLIATYFNESDKKKKESLEKEIQKIVHEFIKAKIADKKKQLDIELKDEEGKLVTISRSNATTPAAKTKKEKGLKIQKAVVKNLLAQLKDLNNQKAELMEMEKTGINTFFLWHLWFCDVFENGGFDILIGNPPYVNIANITDEKYRKYLQNNYYTVKNKSDLYSVFIEKALSLSKENATNTFIYPKTWMGSDSFSKFREFITNNLKIKSIINLGYGVFENATVSTIISISSKQKIDKNDIKLSNISKGVEGNMKFIEQDFKLTYDQIRSTPLYLYSFTKPIDIGTEIVKLGELIEFSLGIKTSDDKKFILDFKKDSDTFPMLRGKNIRRYEHDKPTEYIWYKPQLMMRKVGAGPRKIEYFKTDKILIQSICNNILHCSIDTKKILVNDKVHIAFNPKQYSLKTILAILNSKLMTFIARSMFGNYLEIKINQLHLLPFPRTINKSDQRVLDELVTKRINSKNKMEIDDIESEIDQLVCSIYNINASDNKTINENYELKVIEMYDDELIEEDGE